MHMGPHGQLLGFAAGSPRKFSFLSSHASNVSAEPMTVSIIQSERNMFDAAVKGPDVDISYPNIVCEARSPSISTYFPHTRIESTVIAEGDELTIFQRGRKVQVSLASPPWYEKALGLKQNKNTLLAPMPCKVIRVEVKEGDVVEKDQPLVIIESMKMETVIRSPQRGVISKLAHKEGDICKAGTVLVLFEEHE